MCCCSGLAPQLCLLAGGWFLPRRVWPAGHQQCWCPTSLVVAAALRLLESCCIVVLDRASVRKTVRSTVGLMNQHLACAALPGGDRAPPLSDCLTDMGGGACMTGFLVRASKPCTACKLLRHAMVGVHAHCSALNIGASAAGKWLAGCRAW